MREEYDNNKEIYSKKIKASRRRTYFFDVRETRDGDYFLTITESNKVFDDKGESSYKKKKLFLYKENFEEFIATLSDCTKYIISEKGIEVIGGHQRDGEGDGKNRDFYGEKNNFEKKEKKTSSNNDALDKLKDLDFEDLGG